MKFIFIIFSISMVSLITGHCNYYQKMVINQNYYIYNNEYPGYYGPNTNCRWQAVSPSNSNINLSCNVFDIPESYQCSGDKLAVSLTGDVNFLDAYNYCGQGTLNLMSVSNSLVVELFSESNTSGGQLVCTITAIPIDNQDTCECGLGPMLRIVDGDDAQPNEFPYMVALRDTRMTIVEESQFCGGSIISARYVITAGHCFHNRNISNIRIIAGAHVIADDVDTERRQIFSIENVQIHPKYDPNTVQNDIALIRLATDIVFTNFVGPVCLPFSYTSQSFYQQNITALGWGQLSFSDGNAKILQKVQLQVSQCVANIPVTYDNICTFGEGKDTCIADSGGPILKDINNRMFLIGLVSYGEGCGGDVPSVHTRITQYLQWIIQNAPDAFLCVK